MIEVETHTTNIRMTDLRGIKIQRDPLIPVTMRVIVILLDEGAAHLNLVIAKVDIRTMRLWESIRDTTLKRMTGAVTTLHLNHPLRRIQSKIHLTAICALPWGPTEIWDRNPIDMSKSTLILDGMRQNEKFGKSSKSFSEWKRLRKAVQTLCNP